MKLAIINFTEQIVDIDQTNIIEQIEELVDDPDNVQLADFTSKEDIQKIIENNIDIKRLTLSNIWEDEKSMLFCYFNHSIDNSDNIDPINNWGTQLTSEPTYSKLVIVLMGTKYKGGDASLPEITEQSLTHYSLKQMFSQIYIKIGQIVHPDGKFEEYKYVVSPFEPMIGEINSKENYIYREYELYTRVLIVIFDKRSTVINKIASHISTESVNGIAYFSIYEKPKSKNNAPFKSLDEKLLKKIVQLRNLSYSIGTEYSIGDDYINFDKLIDNEISKYKKQRAK
jgi:hypothetical protein